MRWFILPQSLNTEGFQRGRDMSTTAVLYVNRPHMHIHSHVLLCELDMRETFCTCGSLAIETKQVYLYTTCQQDDLPKCFTKTLNHQWHNKQQKNKPIIIKIIIKKCHLNVRKEKNRNILVQFRKTSNTQQMMLSASSCVDKLVLQNDPTSTLLKWPIIV